MTTREHSRRTVLRAAAAVGGVAALQGAATAIGLVAPRAAHAATTVQSLRSTAKSWLWAAEDYGIGGGFFGQAGLEVNVTATRRGVNTAALIGGNADILLGAPGQTMRAQVQNQPLKLIGGLVNKYASNVVVKQDILDKAGVTEASSVEDKARVLKGLKMGTTGPGAGPDNLLRYLMAKVDINPDREAELTPVQGGGSGLLAAMERGVIDGFCLSSPTADIAIKKFGAAYLFNMATNPPPELNDYLYISVAVAQSAIDERRDMLVDYMRGLALGLRAINSDPNAFKGWATGWFEGLDPDVFEKAFASNSQIYMPDPTPREDHFVKNVEFVNLSMKTLNKDPMPSSFGFTDAYDPSIAADAVKQI